MKKITWTFGVLAALLAFLFLVGVNEKNKPQPTFMDTAIADCKSKARSEYVTGDKNKAVLMSFDCDALERNAPKK